MISLNPTNGRSLHCGFKMAINGELGHMVLVRSLLVVPRGLAATKAFTGVGILTTIKPLGVVGCDQNRPMPSMVVNTHAKAARKVLSRYGAIEV